MCKFSFSNFEITYRGPTISNVELEVEGETVQTEFTWESGHVQPLPRKVDLSRESVLISYVLPDGEVRRHHV